MRDCLDPRLRDDRIDHCLNRSVERKWRDERALAVRDTVKSACPVTMNAFFGWLAEA